MAARRLPAYGAALALASALGLGAGTVSADPMVALAVQASEVEPRIDLPTSIDLATPDVEHEAKWRGLSQGCSYLAPKGDFVGSDGAVDVVFHFHAGLMSDKELRQSGLGAVFVSCGFGIGSGAYADAFADRARFGGMVDHVVADLRKVTRRSDVHVGHLALVSWSAGFAAIGRILRESRYFDMVDAVVLLDSLHSLYRAPARKAPQQGVDKVDVAGMSSFVRFAKEAAAGKKAMIITHSSIIPPDYASSAEATGALLGAIGVPTEAREETAARGMTQYYRADRGDLHVRGYRGRGPRDHFAHLHLVGEVLRSWLVPRWKP